MSKISDYAVKAFYEGRTYSSGNTMVTLIGEQVKLFLHGSEIARRAGPMLAISLQGFPTKTTMGRLRSVVAQVGGNLWQERNVIYWSGPESNGSPQIMPHEGWVLISAGDLMTQVGNLENIQTLTR